MKNCLKLPVQPVQLQVLRLPNTPFHLRHERVQFFPNPLHTHAEYELTLILKSSGIRYVGESAESFSEGDLVLVGSRIPHTWKNDDAYYGTEGEGAEAIILRFSPETFGDALFNFTDFSLIRDLLAKSAAGLKFQGHARSVVTSLLKRLLATKGAERIILFFRVLDVLAHSGNSLLLRRDPVNRFKLSGRRCLEIGSSSRIGKVLRYVTINFTKEIGLDEVAKIAAMNKTAFCRFFKLKTGKTFSVFLNEMRVNHACSLLLKQELNISQVCFASGFNNPSYFNEIFRRVTGKTPTGYIQDRLLYN